MQSRRFALILIGAFAAIALLLSLIGIYGVTSYSVARRTREIGIRMALGAPRGQVLSLLLRQAMLLVISGIVAGVVASLVLTQFLATMLFDVRPRDSLTFVSVVLSLVAVAAFACWIPSRRATRVDPLVALRSE
jgi:putative ABC transport system permease protein